MTPGRRTRTHFIQQPHSRANTLDSPVSFAINSTSADYYNLKLSDKGNLAQADTFGIKSVILG